MSTQTFGTVPVIEVRHRIRIARDHAGLDQGELAARTGISRNTISNYEQGITTHLKPLYLRQIALATGVDEAWLRTGKASPPGEWLPHLDSNQKPFGTRSAA